MCCFVFIRFHGDVCDDACEREGASLLRSQVRIFPFPSLDCLIQNGTVHFLHQVVLLSPTCDPSISNPWRITPGGSHESSAAAQTSWRKPCSSLRPRSSRVSCRKSFTTSNRNTTHRLQSKSHSFDLDFDSFERSTSINFSGRLLR